LWSAQLSFENFKNFTPVLLKIVIDGRILWESPEWLSIVGGINSL